ncbi:MAG: indole-3-glycerol phosphate synthase TrpC [Bacteroidota bacterium]|jgi:indole-3-glycerol phosphate synthase
MEDILNKIVAAKKIEVENFKKNTSEVTLSNFPLFNRTPYSLKEFILDEDKTGIIAEFKRKSPSKGVIKENASPKDITRAYFENGASALSVLTDFSFFGGSVEDLSIARLFNPLPILRKDFIVDAIQIIEAKAIGADAILLIAECLTNAEIKNFANIALDLGLEVLLEVHEMEQLDKWNPAIHLVGINNRNLKTFKVSVEHSFDMLPLMPKEAIKIAESGLNNPETLVELKKAGFNGFLIGEYFMAQENTPLAAAAFMHDFFDKWYIHKLNNDERGA